MPHVFARFGRSASLMIALLMVTLLLAACGGGVRNPGNNVRRHRLAHHLADGLANGLAGSRRQRLDAFRHP